MKTMKRASLVLLALAALLSAGCIVVHHQHDCAHHARRDAWCPSHGH
jgi:hypothetical protein